MSLPPDPTNLAADRLAKDAHLPASTSRRRFWVVGLTLALAAILLYLALREVDWNVFLAVLRQGHYAMLPLLFGLSSLNFFIRSLRWRVLLTAERRLPVSTVFWADMVGYLGNTFLPARAGELIRSAALGYNAQISTSFVLATALTERLMDVIALVLICTLALLALPGIPTMFSDALQGMALMALLGLAILLIMPLLQDLFQRLLMVLPLPASWRTRVVNLLVRFLDGMRSLQNPGRALTFILFTSVIWLLDGFGSVLCAAMLNLQLSLPQALILLAGLGLSSALPSTPGYVGVYQFVAVMILEPFGFSASEAVAYIMVTQVLGYLVIGFWGVLGVWQLNMKNRLREN